MLKKNDFLNFYNRLEVISYYVFNKPNVKIMQEIILVLDVIVAFHDCCNF